MKGSARMLAAESFGQTRLSKRANDQHHVLRVAIRKLFTCSIDSNQAYLASLDDLV